MILNLEKDKKKIMMIAAALSNLKRLELLDELRYNKDTSHKELAEKIGLRSSSISFHLRQLIDAGLVTESITKGLKGRNKKTPVLAFLEIVIKYE